MASTCILCESPLKPFLQTKDHFYTGEPFGLWLCPDCTLLHTRPVPPPDKIGIYYQSDEYLSHNTDKTNLISILYKLVRKISLDNKLKLIAGYKSGNKLLDYGCGTGHFLTACVSRGWEVTGLEPNDQARRLAEENLARPILRDINELTTSYSVITLWHVLEHLHDPEKVILRLKSHLDPGGALILALPNYESPDAGYYKQYWAGYDVPRHLFHFSKNAVEAITRKTGMKIEKIIPMKFDAYYVSLLSEKYIRPGEFPYLRAMHRGWKSNRQARKDTNYSSLIYVIRPHN